LVSVYPTIARWASGYGWVEFGIDGQDRPFVRAEDEGGTVWEGGGPYETLDQALSDMEEGLARFMEEGFTKKRSAKPKAPARSDKRAQKTKDTSRKTPHRADVHPAAKKVENLEEVAEALRRGEDFSVTRLTILKGLCEDAVAARVFALFLTRKVQKKMREKKSDQRHRGLVNRGVKEMRSYLDDPSEENKERLHSLLREMIGEQNEYRRIHGGPVRIIRSKDLLVAEEAVRAILRPAEAPTWLYQAARDYSERYNARYGDGLIPDSAPMVEEIAGFWRKHYGIRR
jgi:hypothetical protein